MGKCIIVSAGSFVPIEISVSDDDLVIACDAGLKYCLQVNVRPDLVIGDFDSVEPEYLDMINKMRADDPESVITLPCEKDDTDTLAAIRTGLGKGYTDFRFYAATGGERIEHTVANIQCLIFLKEHGAKGYLLDDVSLITVIKDESVTLGRDLSGYLSVFAVNGKAEGVTLKNLKYELKDEEVIPGYPVGVSNAFIGESAEISVKKGMLLIIVNWGRS